MNGKKSLELQIDALNQNIQSFQKTTNNNESKLLSIQEQLVMFKAMNNEIGLDLNTIFEEQSHQKHFTNEINDKIEAFKDFYAEESTTIALLWKDHTKDIELLKKDLSGIKLVLDEIKAKITNIVFDCRSFGQIAADAADRIELQERQSDKFKIEINQMKLDMDILENLITSIDITNHTGRSFVLYYKYLLIIICRKFFMESNGSKIEVRKSERNKECFKKSNFLHGYSWL